MPTNVGAVSTGASISAALEAARLKYWEAPGAALADAVRCREQARMIGDDSLQARALTLAGAVSLHRGDLSGAFALVAQAEPRVGADLVAQVELAALKTHLLFFSGSYSDSLHWAHEAVALADRTGDQALRLHARRMGCLAFGNVGVDDLRERFEEVLGLARAAESRWEEAVAMNDLAHLMMEDGDLDGADGLLAA